jgi:hypothetical protein
LLKSLDPPFEEPCHFLFGLKFCVHCGCNKNWFGALEGQKQSAEQKGF